MINLQEKMKYFGIYYFEPYLKLKALHEYVNNINIIKGYGS
jgi:hypothetical protein